MQQGVAFMNRFSSMFRIILLISLLLAALFVLSGIARAETILEPGTPFTFNGSRFLPVGLIDDQELIYKWTRTEIKTDYTLMIRVFCPDGAVPYDEARIFREKITICSRTENEINYNVDKTLPYVKNSMFLFDVVLQLPDKPDLENAYLVLEGHDEWYPVKGLQPMAEDIRTAVDSLTPLVYRGVRFMPVSATADQDLIAMESGTVSDKYRVMVRIQCLDGAITPADAEAFREAVDVYVYLPDRDFTNGYPSPQEVVTAGETFTEFDVIISFPTEFELGNINLKYGHKVSLKSTLALTEILQDNGTENLPVVTLAPTPTPKPTPEPTPSPTPVPTANPMTAKEKSTLQKKLQGILSKNKSIRYLSASGTISIKGKILIAVFDRDGNLQESTLENGFDYKLFKNLPKDRLATSFEKTDTWIFIYPDPEHKLEGRYTNGSRA